MSCHVLKFNSSRANENLYHVYVLPRSDNKVMSYLRRRQKEKMRVFLPRPKIRRQFISQPPFRLTVFKRPKSRKEKNIAQILTIHQSLFLSLKMNTHALMKMKPLPISFGAFGKK